RSVEADMARYIVELYQSTSGEPLRGVADRLRTSAAELVDEGTPVRYLGSLFLPSDETCLHVLDAPSEAEVRVVAGRGASAGGRGVFAGEIDPPRPDGS